MAAAKNPCSTLLPGAGAFGPICFLSWGMCAAQVLFHTGICSNNYDMDKGKCAKVNKKQAKPSQRVRVQPVGRKVTGIISKHNQPKQRIAKSTPLVNWSRMLMDAEAPSLLAPSINPVLATHAKITKSFTFKQAAGEQPVGPLTFLQRSDFHNSFFATSNGAPDALGSRNISVQGTIVVNGDVRSGAITYRDRLGNSRFAVPVLNQGRYMVPLAVDDNGDFTLYWQIEMGPGVVNTGTSHSCVANTFTAANVQIATTGTVTVQKGIYNSNYLAAPGGSAPAWLDLRGVDANVYKFSIGFQFSYTGIFPSSGNNPLHMDLLTDEWLQDREVGAKRVTGMQMLVTDLTAPLASAGEVISCRVSERLLERSATTSDLRENIKSLPEQHVWRSGHIRDGAYVWWLPEDSADYDFDAPSDIGNDTCNLVVFDLPATGAVRVTCTWFVEFYTQDPTYPRDYTPVFTPEARMLMAALSRMPATMENLTHEQILAGLAKAASTLDAMYRAGKIAVEVGEVLALLLL